MQAVSRTGVCPMTLPRLVKRLLLLAIACSVLVGCATPVIRDTAGVVALRPTDVQQAPPAQHDGADVLWGGRIVAFDNRADHAEIEVVAFPLDRAQQPVTDAPSEGRFVLVLPGYVEALDYPVGRHLTVRGTLAGSREGLVQEHAYVYPIVRGRDVHVWPWGFMLDRRPRVSIGIGVGIR
jgi:outer membrane lipoprotein